MEMERKTAAERICETDEF